MCCLFFSPKVPDKGEVVFLCRNPQGHIWSNRCCCHAYYGFRQGVGRWYCLCYSNFHFFQDFSKHIFCLWMQLWMPISKVSWVLMRGSLEWRQVSVSPFLSSPLLPLRCYQTLFSHGPPNTWQKNSDTARRQILLGEAVQVSGKHSRDTGLQCTLTHACNPDF